MEERQVGNEMKSFFFFLTKLISFLFLDQDRLDTRMNAIAHKIFVLAGKGGLFFEKKLKFF